MALTYQGRVEARATVPTGGASVSASIGASASASTVTIPAGNYLLTAAGGVSSLLTVLQQQLNDNVQGYPQTAAAMQAAVGWGTWTSGWLFNIASGNDTGAFGGVTMTAVSTPTYGTQGPAGATAATIDKAIGFDSSLDAFSGGNNFDLTNTDDICIAWVAYFPSNPGTSTAFISKITNAAGWHIYTEATNVFTFRGRSSAPATLFQATGASIQAGTWHVGIATVDRATGKARIATCPLGGSPSVSTEVAATATTSSNAVNFQVGDDAGATGAAPLTAKIAAVYIGKGSGVAAGMSANLSTAVQNLANAINDSWSVSLSTTTGLITCSGSFWPRSVSWTNTSLRDVLGFAYDFDYPQTAAQMATALGYGAWTNGAGYLCNEAAGNIASVFGTPASLTAASTPTYSNLGPRGGADKAVGFDSAADQFGGAASNFEVSAANDLIVAYVGKWSALPAAFATVVSKIAAAAASGWAIYTNDIATAHGLLLQVNGGSAFASTVGSAGYCLGEWQVAIAVVDRSTGKCRFGTQGLRSGTQTLSTETTVAGDFTTAASFDLGLSAWTSSPLAFQLGALYVVTGASVATGLSANLSTALSNFATYMKAQTSTQQARGLWFPSCPISLVGDPSVAPRVTDKRDSMSPTGQMFSLVGNAYRRHQGVMWESVPQAQTWQAFAPLVNASFEEFANDCLYGLGHAWFKPGSPLQIYWDNAGTQRALGYTYNSSAGVPGWTIVNLSSTEPKRSFDKWTGYFRIEFGDVVSTE